MMSDIKEILKDLNNSLKEEEIQVKIGFSDYLERLAERPRYLLRDIFQLVHDMVLFYVPPGVDEFPDDPESVNYM